MTTLLATPEPQQWLLRFGDELYRFALGRVADAATAEDLVQETLVSALDALDSFRGQASERTWLFVILKRKIIDHYRRQARSPFVPLAITPDQAPEAEFFRVWQRILFFCGCRLLGKSTASYANQAGQRDDQAKN